MTSSTHNRAGGRLHRRALRLRPAVAALDWLADPPRWRDGRAAWPRAGGALAPTEADLARAAESLAQLAARPALAARLLGDAPAWLAARGARLAEARYLAQLPPADLAALAAGARAGDHAATRALVALLPAEALCAGALPISPAATLAARGGPALPALEALARSEAAPRLGRALAALVAGAVRCAGGEAAPAVAPGCPLARAALAHGLAHGLPAEPALTAALLDAPGGEALAGALAAALAARHPFCLEPADLRALRADGVPPGRVVALAEAAAAAAGLAERLGAYEGRLVAEQRSPARARRALARYRADVGRLAQLFRRCVRASGDPEVARLAARLVGALLDLARRALAPLRAAALLLERAAAMPAGQIRPLLALLDAAHAQIWNPAQMPGPGAQTPMLESALRTCHQRSVLPAADLLERCGDPRVVRAALAGGYAPLLARCRLRAPALYGWLVARLRAFPSPTPSLVGELASMVRPFTDAARARAAADPLLAAVASAPPRSRGMLLELLLQGLDLNRETAARDLPRLAPYVRVIAARCDPGSDGAPPWVEALAPAILALDRQSPDDGPAALAALLAGAGAWGEGWDMDSLSAGLLLAAEVAADDPARLAAIVATAARHPFVSRRSHADAGIAALRRAPALRAAFAQLFPQRPRRLGELLERIGMAEAIAPGALAPLAAAPEGDGPALLTGAPGWRDLLALAPECADAAAALLHARWVLGEAPELPPGAARALAQPVRLGRELAHLGGLAAASPGRADLAARARALAARLADPGPLWAAAAREAAERLRQAAAEAQVAAAEQLLREAAAARLRALGASLAAGEPEGADLLNAVLLWADAGANRSLLRELLRAYGEARPAWREELPPNAAFLAGLAERGADPAAWLGDHPAAFPLPGAPGGRVTIALERDPIHVLQMGNYFDTCLSVGSSNAFSTVANAVDLNKRVLYARDGEGRVVGRKLVAVSDEWRLVGFHTYTACSSEELNGRLAELVDAYLRQFAARCRLELADEGAVPTLAAAAWYDDGAVAWARPSENRNDDERTKTHPHQQDSQLPPPPSARRARPRP